MDISQKRFVVSIYEIQQELVFAEEFTGLYVKDLKLWTALRAPLN